MLPGDMGRTGRQWNVISEPYPGLRGYATAYSWNPLRKGLLTGIYVLPNSSRFFSMRFTPLNSRIFLHLNPKSHLLSNLKGRRLQIYLRPFSWLILRLLCLRFGRRLSVVSQNKRRARIAAPCEGVIPLAASNPAGGPQSRPAPSKGLLAGGCAANARP